MGNFSLSPDALALLEQMSRDMAVPVEGLVNQAVFNWAKLHGYLEPSPVEAGVPITAVPSTTEPVARPLEEPETSRVPVVAEPDESEWQVLNVSRR